MSFRRRADLVKFQCCSSLRLLNWTKLGEHLSLMSPLTFVDRNVNDIKPRNFQNMFALFHRHLQGYRNW